MIAVALLLALPACKREDHSFPTANELCAHMRTLQPAGGDAAFHRCVYGLSRIAPEKRDPSWPAMLRATDIKQFSCLGNTTTEAQVRDCLSPRPSAAGEKEPAKDEKADEDEKEEEEGAGEAGDITMGQYLHLQTGMTRAQVVHILGRDGKATARKKPAQISTAVVIWENERGSNLTAVFEKDRLVSKSQVGLRGFR
jgi:hypothetical protein